MARPEAVQGNPTRQRESAYVGHQIDKQIINFQDQ